MKKWLYLSLLDLVILCIILPAVKGCGSFLTASASSFGGITVPNYPAAYSNYTRCIWLIEAPGQHQVKLNLTFAGGEVNSQCSDYIEIRDGSLISNLQLSTCSTLYHHIIRSSGRWIWLYFKSDSLGATSGLTATYTAVYVGSSIDNITSPVAKCRTFQFECANKECISTSYKCDGYNDCGCNSEYCDESDCNGIDMRLEVMYAIGSCLGIILFIAVCMGSYIYERKYHWTHLKKVDAAEVNPEKTKR